MKTKTLSLVIIAILLNACSETDPVSKYEDIETITEQDIRLDTISENHTFYKYKHLIDELNRSKVMTSNETSNMIEEDIETILEQDVSEKPFNKAHKIYKYQRIIEQLEGHSEKQTTNNN